MLDQEQAAEALRDLLAAYRLLDGLGGASLRKRRGLATDADLAALEGWERGELNQERQAAQTQLDDLLDEAVRSGLEDLLFRVAAVTGLSADDEQVQQRLIDEYDLGEVESVRPLLREVARPLRPRRRGNLFGEQTFIDGSKSIWRPYDYWNAALVETVFNQEHAGRSVYLDMEPEVIQRAAELIWPPIGEAGVDLERAFRRTVERTCVTRPPILKRSLERDRIWDGNANFSRHAQRVEAWGNEQQTNQESVEQAPPSIALLALCSLAAERMRADRDKAASNYYGRLAEVLALSEASVTQLGSRYREHALLLWGSLNVWLRDLHGRRGLPTAVSFGHHRFISLPISQALIRAQERERLSEFFARYQFNPGQQVARDDMEGMLGRWIPESGASGLREVWSRGPEMRRRIADVVCTELEHWAGEPRPSSDAGREQRTLLAAATWYEEPEPEFEPFLCLRAAETDEISGSYRMADGVLVQAQRDADGLITLGFAEPNPPRERALFASAISGGLQLKHETRELTLALGGQNVIVLLFDPLRQVYIQSARVELGRELLLLVDSSLSAAVQRTLERSAEDGFRVVPPAVHELPSRWTLFSNVRLHSLPSVGGAALEPLQPYSRAQVELEGGVQLTNNRWHTKAPPAVLALDGQGRSFRVTLHSQSNLDEQPRQLGVHAGEARIALADRGLSDGDYRIVLSEPGQTVDGGAEITSRTLKLRSARSAHLDPPRPSSEQLAYAAEPSFLPRAALSAEPAEEGTGVLRGAVIDQRGLRAVPETKLQDEMGGVEPVESVEDWIQRLTGTTKEADLELARTYLRLGFVEHKNGALVRTAAGTLHLHKIRPQSQAGQRSSHSAAGGSRDLGVDLDLILDALAVIEAGSWNAFRRLIEHSESERFVPHEALRTLRALGHLDVEVVRRNVAPRRWSLPPPALAALPEGNRAVLTGRRTPALRERLRDAADAAGARVDESAASGRPMRIEVAAEHRGILQQIADATAVPLIFDAPRRILERMPTIQEILASQPELIVPPGCTYERFHRASNRWLERDASTERRAGGYRIRFPTGERRHAVWADGVWRECGSATAKYAGAAAVGEHMLAYDAARQELTCLLGARPPGLFERALTLCSGELPRTPGDHQSIYRNVPDYVHRWIAAKLGPAGWRR